MTTIRALLTKLAAGRATTTETAAKLGAKLTPVRTRPPAETQHERFRREQTQELPPETPGSWDDVRRAYLTGELTQQQYYALLRETLRPAATRDE